MRGKALSSFGDTSLETFNGRTCSAQISNPTGGGPRQLFWWTPRSRWGRLNASVGSSALSVAKSTYLTLCLSRRGRQLVAEVGANIVGEVGIPATFSPVTTFTGG